MNRQGKATWWVVGILALGVILSCAAAAFWRYYWRPIALYGAVITEDPDPEKQSPITDVEIRVAGSQSGAVRSDFAGYFKLVLPRRIRRGQKVQLQFRRAGYEPLDTTETVGSELYIERMTPIQQDVSASADSHQTTVANVVLRYTAETTTELNIGSQTRLFQIQNKGNTPCEHHLPCSPDARWKAAIGSAELDAGEGNFFRDASVTCIAGPCPFTRIATDQLSAGDQKFSVSVIGWSDTTTFLMQAETFRKQIRYVEHESYPIIFGQSMSFTVPPDADGASLEAAIGGTTIVFPLGPVPILSWADCKLRVEKDRSQGYRCELKPGFRFETH